MKELPILFSTPMVKAILEGRKTQTRRILTTPFMRKYGKTHPEVAHMRSVKVIYQDGGGNWIGWDEDGEGLAEFTKKAYPNGEGFKSPYQVGDHLWVKETYFERNGMVIYKASRGDVLTGDTWKSGRFMFKKYARLWLEVTEVRAQRLQEITNGDALAEGIECHDGRFRDYYPKSDYSGQFVYDRAASYQSLWDSINGKTHPWSENPWVWAYTFKRIEH